MRQFLWSTATTSLGWLLLFLLLAPTAGAQMAEILREEFHDFEELGIVMVHNSDLPRLERIMEDPETRAIALQADADALTPEHVAGLLSWIREGHSLLVYDPHALPFFGMQPLMLKPFMFKWKPEEGQLGGKVVQGVATTVMSIRNHTVTTGVGQCTIFLQRFGEGEEAEYGAVELSGDTFALLQFTLDSPALCAMRRDGRGMIVYKPLLWPDVLSGDRFQANLLEFAAGFQVPGPAGSGKIGRPPGPQAEYIEGRPAVPLDAAAPAGEVDPEDGGPPLPEETATVPAVLGVDRLQTSAEGEVSGIILNEALRFETGSSSLTLDRKLVRAVQIGSAVELDQLEMRDGTVHKGLLITQELRLQTPDGEQVFEKRDLKRINFAETVPES